MNIVRAKGIPLIITIFALLVGLLGSGLGFMGLIDPTSVIGYIEGADVLALTWAGRNLGLGFAPYAANTPSGHTSTDGATEIVDLDLTEANKEIVHHMIEDVLMVGGDPGQIDDYISAETYIQHNKDVPDGLEHFRPLAMAENVQAACLH